MIRNPIFIIAVVIGGFGLHAPGTADEVIMTTGEWFQTSEVWEEDGKIRFNMQGLIVSVEKDDVAAVINDQNLTESAPPSVSDQEDSTAAVADILAKPDERTLSQGTIRPNSRPSSKLPARGNQDSIPQPSDPAFGILEVYWKMRPRELPGLEKIETDPAFGGVDQYRRPEQLLRWGRADLDGWVYGFWKDQLYSILIWSNGRSGYETLRQETFAAYGAGKPNIHGKERYLWVSATTQRMLEFDAQLGIGLLVMRSTEVDAQIKKIYPAFYPELETK